MLKIGFFIIPRETELFKVLVIIYISILNKEKTRTFMYVS